jgi:dihydroxyacetone kinase-like protein
VPDVDTGFVLRWLAAAARSVDREAGRLTELDSPIGDADHGTNMRRGFTALTAALAEDPPDTPGGALALAGRTLIATVGGASGPLYGTLLRRTGKALGDAATAGPADFAAAFGAGVAAVAQLGGSAPGDKTMLDALVPAAEALAADPEDFTAARRAADEGAVATVPMRARRGRASYLGERSIGHQDPGAVSATLLMAALAGAAESGAAEAAAEAGDG